MLPSLETRNFRCAEAYFVKSKKIAILQNSSIQLRLMFVIGGGSAYENIDIRGKTL